MNIRRNDPEQQFIEDIKSLLGRARSGIAKQINTTMVNTYYEIGRRIVEQEQNGETTAKYGDYLLSKLSDSLSSAYGKGGSKRNLELIRQFYLTYKNAKSMISHSLSWTHYIRLMRIEDEAERRFYEKEENKTIGIILCRDKKDTLIEITLPENNNQIFASRYKTVLPSKEELAKLLEYKK
ncbi:MAG: DUF1016 family protein [Parabacteroides sp.]|nr:DUF1016 family protein [Parabacteroides sp.]